MCIFDEGVFSHDNNIGSNGIIKYDISSNKFSLLWNSFIKTVNKDDLNGFGYLMDPCKIIISKNNDLNFFVFSDHEINIRNKIKCHNLIGINKFYINIKGINNKNEVIIKEKFYSINYSYLSLLIDEINHKNNILLRFIILFKDKLNSKKIKYFILLFENYKLIYQSEYLNLYEIKNDNFKLKSRNDKFFIYDDNNLSIFELGFNI
jgi:hypothetical protein